MKFLSGLSENPSCIIFDAKSRLRRRLENAEWESSYRLKFLNYAEKSGSDDGTYRASDEVAQGCGEITLLCGRSHRNLIARYPYRSRYVFFHIDLMSISFYLGLVGFARRYVLGLSNINSQIRVLGIKRIGVGNSWFVLLKNPNATVTNHYSISSDIGYGGFLNQLNQSNKRYVVLRFFEKLPDGNRRGGDLDILVEDSLEGEASEFLTKNPGILMVDMYSVHSAANASRIPYHTPYLSEKILNEAVMYKGFKVPSKINYLNSFIYHCLYHKGLSSGIPTKYKNLESSDDPDNNYLAKIQELGTAVDVSPGTTLEELDDYMKHAGWRPHTDTLDLLASTNKWLSFHLINEFRHEEITLTICVLKKGFHESHRIKDFEKALQELGLEILSHEALEGQRLALAANHLRGGNWSATNEPQYLPSDIFVLFDSSVAGVYCRRYKGLYDPRSKKEKLRKIFDVKGESMIHMTDNTHQTLEYIEVLEPKRSREYIDQVKYYDAQNKTIKLNAYDRLLIPIMFNVKNSKKKLFAFFKQIV